jgi:sodium transport system permease protein
VKLGVMDGVRLALVMLPVALLAGGVQLVVATFARSFREAQTYLSVLTLLPMLPGMWLTVAPMDSEPWTVVVPILGQQAVLMDVIRGNPVGAVGFVVPAVIAIAIALVCVRVTAWLLGREKIIFGS